MSLAGAAAIAIWNDVEHARQTDFREWHNREHAPERIGIPGFLRARRYVSVLGESPDSFFMLYEVDSPNAFDSAEYTHRLNTPTDWTSRMSSAFSNSARSLSKVELSRGVGQGGLIETFRYDLSPDDADAHYRWLAHGVLPALSDPMGVTGVHLCRTDMSRSVVASREKQGRKISAPNWVLLIEGTGTADSVGTATDELRAGLAAAALPGTLVAGRFQLE